MYSWDHIWKYHSIVNCLNVFNLNHSLPELAYLKYIFSNSSSADSQVVASGDTLSAWNAVCLSENEKALKATKSGFSMCHFQMQNTFCIILWVLIIDSNIKCMRVYFKLSLGRSLQGFPISVPDYWCSEEVPWCFQWGIFTDNTLDQAPLGGATPR